MTEKDKDILIEKMLDRPAELSTADIAVIMADEELRELYDTSVMLADSLQRQPVVDNDREWELFSRRLAVGHTRSDAVRKPERKLLHLRRVVRVVAVVAGVMLLSAVVVRMMRNVSDGDMTLDAGSMMTAESVVQQPDTVGMTDTSPEVGIADTLAGEHIADGAPAGRNVAAANSRSTVSVIHTPDDFNIDEYIEIEQARIDNEVAMAVARVYEAEYSTYLDVTEYEPDIQPGDDAPVLSHIVDPQIDRLVML